MLKLEYTHVRDKPVEDVLQIQFVFLFFVRWCRSTALAHALIELMRNKLSSIYSCTKLLHHVFCYGQLCTPTENYGEKKYGIWIEECSMVRMQSMKNVKAWCRLPMLTDWMSRLYRELRSEQINLMKIFTANGEDEGCSVDGDGAHDCYRFRFDCSSSLHAIWIELIYFRSLSNLYAKKAMGGRSIYTDCKLFHEFNFDDSSKRRNNFPISFRAHKWDSRNLNYILCTFEFVCQLPVALNMVDSYGYLPHRRPISHHSMNHFVGNSFEKCNILVDIWSFKIHVLSFYFALKGVRKRLHDRQIYDY